MSSAPKLPAVPRPSLPRWLLPATLGLIVACFLVRNLPWNLDDYDQAKQAYVSFEMVHAQSWWFQHTPAQHIATKPPLVGWISAGLALATGGAWDFAWRLPPLVCALLLLWLVTLAGWRLDGRRGAILAAAAVGLNSMAPRLATVVRTDMALCLSIFLAGYLVFERLRTRTPWTTGARWQMFAIILASMLTKGPIAYAFLLPGLLTFWWCQRGTENARLAWSGWWNWFAPLLVFGAWASLGIWQSREFYEEVVQKEFLGRFTVGAAARHHNQELFFYLLHLLEKCFPWSLLLLLLLGNLPAPGAETITATPNFWRRFLARLRDRWTAIRAQPELCWLFCWAVGGLVFMSLVPSKRVDRIFPVVPPFALLLAGLMPRNTAAAQSWLGSRRALFVALALALAGSGGYVAYQVAQGYRGHQGALPVFGQAVRQHAGAEAITVVDGRDEGNEGLLLYLQVSHFTRWKDAMEGWQAGHIRALVLPVELWQTHAGELAGARQITQSEPIPDQKTQYTFIQAAP